jgi:hypothetical protein
MLEQLWYSDVTELTKAIGTVDADKCSVGRNFSAVKPGASSEFLTCIRDSGLTDQQVTDDSASLGASVDILINVF